MMKIFQILQMKLICMRQMKNKKMLKTEYFRQRVKGRGRPFVFKKLFFQKIIFLNEKLRTFDPLIDP